MGDMRGPSKGLQAAGPVKAVPVRPCARRAVISDRDMAAVLRASLNVCEGHGQAAL